MFTILKHLKKFIPCLSASLLVTTPILITTGCSCTFELNLTQQEQYIYDRTFSIYGKNDSSVVLGTGWIISDATKSDTNDYTYWLATNWHVVHQMENVYCSQYYYGDNSLTYMTSYIPYKDYLPFASFKKETTSNFLYELPVGSTWIPCIDLYVAKVDFGSPTGDIKKKLDKLNECQKTNGYINKFAKDSKEIRSKNKIIGGYPVKESGTGGQWESHSFAASNLAYYEKGYKFDETNSGHPIGDPMVNQKGEDIGGSEVFPYWDISPQYKFEKAMANDFMTHGASGSMMITEDYEVCGIYWGGWSANEEYYPAFSLFNTDERNFLEQYI